MVQYELQRSLSVLSLLEPEATTAIVLIVDHLSSGICHRPAPLIWVWNEIQLFKFEPIECIDHLIVGIDPMGIEHYLRLSHRHDKKQVPAPLRYPF